ncbi:MAG: hypothetical protein ACTIJJ_04625 [Galactobacter sp.]
MSTTIPQPQQPQFPTQYTPVPPKRGNGWGVAALVIGVVAVVLAFIPLIGVAGIVLGAIAVILAIIGLVVKGRAKGTSVAGLVLGAVAIIIGSIVLAITTAAVDAVDDVVKEVDADSKAKHSVEYIVSVNKGTASVDYGTSDGTSNEDFEGTWTKKESMTGWDTATVFVTGDFETQGQKLSCEVKVDGKTESKHSGTDSVDCTVDTF